MSLFGAELRRRRKEAGLTLVQLAAKIPCSHQMVGFVERGQRMPSANFVAAVERALGLHGDLRALASTEGQSPDWFAEWPAIEASAHTLRAWEPLLIPGLLQTPRYAEATLRGRPRNSDRQVQDYLKTRLARQRIFTRPKPPSCLFVLDQGILSRPIGGRAVLVEQLDHLLDMMARPYISIQVVPIE